jgi:hypothetical protein
LRGRGMVNVAGRPTAPVVLSSDEREYLERQVRRRRVALLSGAGSFCDAQTASRARLSRSNWVCMSIPLGSGDGGS